MIAWNLALKSCSHIWAKFKDAKSLTEQTHGSFDVLPNVILANDPL